MDEETKTDFHIYEPDGMPWKWCIAFAEGDTVTQEKLRSWCLETYGEPSDHMYYSTDNQNWHDVVSYGEIYLKSDKELFLFNLKWLTNGT